MHGYVKRKFDELAEQESESEVARQELSQRLHEAVQRSELYEMCLAVSA